jgi:hypothetical protein
LQSLFSVLEKILATGYLGSMRKWIAIALILATTSSGIAQESTPVQRTAGRRGEVAGSTSRDATTLSMMGWGVVLAVGIATLCALIENNSASTHN